MALNLYHLLLLVTLTSFSGISATASGRDGGKVDGVGAWALKADDPHIQELGAIVVAMHNLLEKKQLIFQKVITWEHAGLDFHQKMVIAAIDAGITKHYDAVVWCKPWLNFQKLISFTPQV